MTNLEKWVEEVRARREESLVPNGFKNTESLDFVFHDLPKALRIIERMKEALEFYKNSTSAEYIIDDANIAEDCLIEIEEELKK